MDKLIILIQNREEAAYILLIEKYSRLMWKIAWGILKGVADIADVEDCISEVFYKLWKSPELLDPDKGSIKSYLVQMTRNTAIDLIRKRSRERTDVLDEAMCADGSDDDILNAMIHTEQMETLYRVLDTLNKRDRELINRRYFENQKPAQISVDMHLPLREVGNRLYRINGSIRKQILWFRNEGE